MKHKPEPPAGGAAKKTRGGGFLKRIIRDRRDGTLKDTLEDFRWIFRYTKKYRKYVFIQTVFGILGATLGLISAIISKYTVDIVTNRRSDSLAFMVVSMFVSAIIGIVFSSLQSRVSTRISLRVFNDIRGELFDRLMDGEWKGVRSYPSGDIINRLNNDTSRVASIAISFIPQFIVTLYSFVASFVAILYYNVSIALIALAGAPFLALVGRRLLKKSRLLNKIMFEKQSGVMSFEAETFNNYDTVKSLGASQAYSFLFGTRQEEHRKAALDANMFSIRSRIYLKTVGYIVSFATFGYCLLLLWADKITYGTMTFFLSQRSRVTSGFSALLELLPQMVTSAVSARRVRELYELPMEQHELDPAEVDALTDKHVTVRLDEVTFGYESDREVIKRAVFTAKPGEVIALVGPSGQGKTTMLRLMLGLIEPQKGSAALIDEEGASHRITADHRRLFSYVPQGNTVVSGTIADNLRITNADASEDEMISALKIACAWDFVERMGGLDAKIGERGHGLSEGQAQRLSIARAVLRKAPVLLLDEATSSLDTATERAIINNTVAQHSGKTCIVSTHRLSVLELADRIYRVTDGGVFEIGLEEALRTGENANSHRG